MPQQPPFAGPQVPQQPAQQQQEQPLAGYFANLPADQLIGELRTRALNSWNALQNRGLPTLWRLAYAQAFGMDPNTARNATQRLEFCGSQSQYIRFRIQLARSHVKQRNQLAQGQRPSFECVAVNDDASSLAQVGIAGKALTYVFRQARGEFALSKAADSDGFFGEGAIWVRWDAEAGDKEKFQKQVPATDQFTGQPLFDAPGQPTMRTETGTKPTGAPTYTTLYPWNVTRDPNTLRPSWIETREKTSKYELIALYPELADQLQGLTLTRETEPGALELFQWDMTSATDDVLAVKHWYHRACKAVPGGRYVGYVGDVVLWDKPCPLAEGLPIVSICSANYFDTPFGYPETADLLSLQEALDELWSQGITNALKFGNQNLWGEDGVEFDQQAFAKGGAYFTMKTGQKPPQAIQFAEMPESFKYMTERLPVLMGVVSGMNPTQMGTPENNITSGVFATLMQATAEKFVSSSQQAYDFAVDELGNVTLELVRTNSDTQFAAQVAGEANIPYMKYFTADDFGGIKRVQVQRQSPVMNNIGGRFEVFERTVNLPPAQRKSAIQMLATGDASAWTEIDTSTLILVRKENELLMRGQQCEVSKSDDFRDHVPSHRASLDRLRTQDPPAPNTPEFQQWNAAIQAHIQHIAQHPVMWAQTDPIYAIVCGLPPPPQFDPMAGQFVPHPDTHNAPPPQSQGPQPPGAKPTAGGKPPQPPQPGGQTQAAPAPAAQRPAPPQGANAPGATQAPSNGGPA
jgi:hypothetical protein